MASSYDVGVIEALKVTFPDFLQGHITAVQWFLSSLILYLILF
jgi:hypothetical protein